LSLIDIVLDINQSVAIARFTVCEFGVCVCCTEKSRKGRGSFFFRRFVL